MELPDFSKDEQFIALRKAMGIKLEMESTPELSLTGDYQMTATQTDQLAKAIGRSTAYHTSDRPHWRVIEKDVALAVGEATADVCADICAEIYQPFDRDRFLKRVTDAHDATYRKRCEERSEKYG